MKACFLILAVLLGLVSCQQGSKPPPPASDKKVKAEFAKRYKRYRCTSKVPFTEQFKGDGEQFRSRQFGDHLILKLKLGKLVHLNETPGGPMRTQSRYQLFCDGKLQTEAESLFSTSEDFSDGSPLLSRFYYNPHNQSLLVVDELAWTTFRYIVFEKSEQTQTWLAKCITPPSRCRSDDAVTWTEGQILGIGDGKLYLEMDGQRYAFPFDDFIDSNLTFTVG
jgi:hypothetical protein